MSGVVEFILARLDEDFAEFDVRAEFDEQGRDLWLRLMADVLAKRRVLDVVKVHSHDSPAARINASDVARALATTYSSHPDYDKSWRP